jgi:hypothetical protein
VRGRRIMVGREGGFPSSQVDGMQDSVVGSWASACRTQRDGEREPRHQPPPEAWSLHNTPQQNITAQIAVRAQQRAEAALDAAPRHEDRVSVARRLPAGLS